MTGEPAAALPGPPPTRGLSWRGHAFAFYRDPLRYVGATYRAYGPLSALTHATPQLVFATGPAFNEQILSQPALFASSGNQRIMPWIDSATLLRLLRPHSNASDQPLDPQPMHMLVARLVGQRERIEQIVLQRTEQMLAGWALGQQVDLAYVMHELSVRIMIEAVFGIDPTQNGVALVEQVRRWRNMLHATPSSLLALDPLHLTQRRWAQASAQLIAAITAQTSMDQPSEDGGTAMSLDHAAQIATVIIAAHSACAAVLTWTLFLLSQHVRVLGDVEHELRFEQHTPTIELEQRMPLMRRVIKESMRLFPPFSLGWRTTTTNVRLGEVEVPAHTPVVFSPYLAQRQAPVYVAPDLFRPERWLYIDPSPYEYLPLQADPLGSIIAPLLHMQLPLMLATLIRRYHLALAAGAKIDRSVRLTLLPKPDIPMIIMSSQKPVIYREARGAVQSMVLVR